MTEKKNISRLYEEFKMYRHFFSHISVNRRVGNASSGKWHNVYFIGYVNVKQIYIPKNRDHGRIYAAIFIFQFDNLLKIK